MRRVVVTGLGFVSSLAPDAKGTWEALLAGRHGLRRLSHLDLPGEPAQIAAEVDLDPSIHPVRRATQSERMALMALEEALAQSGPPLERLDPRRIGIFQGAATTGLPAAEDYLLARMQGRRASPELSVYRTPAILSDTLGRRLGATGPRATVMNACSSSLLSLGQAWERVAAGELDLAASGGAESLCRMTYTGFSSLKAMDPHPCRPFSRDRAGMNLGEGAAQFLLEPLEQARARGADILGEVVGYGASLDAHHPTAPHPEGAGAARAMGMALRVGRLSPESVDLVSAHATATPANDGAEALAIRTVLGEAADRVSVTGSKSQFGHCLGAAGAVGTAVALLALRHQVVSPTLRLEDPDPLCTLDCTPKVAKERRVRAALVNAFAFGGNNVCLALKRWEGR
ncbi:MAG: beta-ketoacyl-[acyl-carrier-protein] synthase family protein [Acidobacteria bacterium]|nr:beta-ketoacyl-[acyl-carrier-protein] synthase family protein [Acidobacteriota bacterium]